MKVILGRAGGNGSHPSRGNAFQAHVYNLKNDGRLAAKIWEGSILLFPTATATVHPYANNTH